MSRLLVVRASVVLGFAFSFGCVPKNESSELSAPAGAPPVAAPLADPAEQNREPAELQQPIQWQAQGTDTLGRTFTGYLVVEGTPEHYLRRGYFQWHADVGGGRYHFEGTYDPTTRTVRWMGFTVKDRIGLPCCAVYEATLSADGRRFESGKWSGGISVPGNWTAIRMGE
jgi:hypothetical protein